MLVSDVASAGDKFNGTGNMFTKENIKYETTGKHFWQ